jgi:GAF domain-containing protein
LVALGAKSSGEPYTNHDLRYLESLGDQAALAVERANVIANLERRVREMDVLTRVARGINITLAFDDILELIYTQTNLLIPTRDLCVTLRDNATQTLSHAFYLQNDERLRENEHISLSQGHNLEEEIIRSHQALVTDDLERECRGRGFLPHDADIFAWMGVPLNAGAETIGVISMGSRDPSFVYNEQQLNMLQAIADQAAGAIVKARLLQESEQRTRQLATLNEVGKSLTSTLELRPLLNKILQSATEILNCEAGSLFMLDSQTNELIFEFTVGPVADELVGQRLPPRTGLVGEAVFTGQPIIANDVHQTRAWSDLTDKKTGFITRDLMVVPMKVHERVIGVIEVINKTDGTPFDQDDQELLTTFASQAAISVENARLYTQTDQALSARVEELSIMQRIDRELNASLDLERSMRITLEWAMSQSHADAGLVGLLKNEAGEGQPPALIIAFEKFDHGADQQKQDNGSAGLYRPSHTRYFIRTGQTRANLRQFRGGKEKPLNCSSLAGRVNLSSYPAHF